MSATKAAHGHLLGAAGAIEALVTVLALYYQRVPPTVHLIAQDTACDIPLVREEVVHVIEHALSFSFAFGGLNAILALRRYRDPVSRLLSRRSSSTEMRTYAA